MSDEVAYEGTICEIARWAGRKLSDHRLRELSKAQASHDKEKFDQITLQLFESKCCTQDWRLEALLDGSDDERLAQFRDALWRHVAPAIGDYTDQSCKARVDLYLRDLERDSLTSVDEDALMANDLEGVLA